MSLSSSYCRCEWCAPPSGLGTEAEQLHEGVKEALQPALVSHALLHHLLLPGVLRRLLDAVRLRREPQVGYWSAPRVNSFTLKRPYILRGNDDNLNTIW